MTRLIVPYGLDPTSIIDLAAAAALGNLDPLAAGPMSYLSKIRLTALSSAAAFIISANAVVNYLTVAEVAGNNTTGTTAFGVNTHNFDPAQVTPFAVVNQTTDGSGNFAAVYNNGVLGVGATLTQTVPFSQFQGNSGPMTTGQVVLLTDQAALFQNGPYVITAQGSIAAPAILTRLAGADTIGTLKKGVYTYDPITNHTYQMTRPNPVTMGASDIIFEQISYVDRAGLNALDFSVYPTLSLGGALGPFGTAPGVSSLVADTPYIFLLRTKVAGTIPAFGAGRISIGIDLSTCT